MSYNQTLRSAIAAAIKTPANPKITGAALQAKLLAILDALDSGAVFNGPAEPSTNPDTESNCFYLATTTGTYSNFIAPNGNPIVLVDGEVALLSSFTTQESQTIRWTKSTVVTPETPNGYVAYAINQNLTPQDRSRALKNIGAAAADGENPNLVAGDIIPKSTIPIETNNEFNIQPTGGDADLKSGSSLFQVIRGNLSGKMEPFLADTWVSTGMNLVNPEQTLTIDGRTAYYFPVAKGTWGSYGTTQENNGYIIVGNDPYAVYYSETVPTLADYGTALTPVNYNGRNYYTTPKYGWIVVIVNSESDVPAMHLAWSNYMDDIAGVFANNVKRIGTFVQWIHAWGMAALFGSDYAVFDEINIKEQKCYRRIDRAALNSLVWTMTVETSEDEGGSVSYTYVFTATVSTMKSGGLYVHNYPGIEVSGNTLTFRSSDITTVPDFVIALGSTLMYFELATVASATFVQIGATLTTDDISNDFGLNYFINNGEIASVPAFVTQSFQQGGKDQLFNAVTYQKILAEVCALAFCEHEQRLLNLENRKDIECENLFVNRSASIIGWREVYTAPASATAEGIPGDYYIATDYIYICVAVNTWKRSQLSTF